MTELAQRAVACKGLRWLPGMLPLVVDEDGDCVACDRVWRTQGGHTVVPAEAFPDLSDPATVGCLLALVAQAHGVGLDDVHVVRTTGRVWSVWVFRPDRTGLVVRRARSHDSSYRVSTHEPSRAEALIAALEAAP